MGTIIGLSVRKEKVPDDISSLKISLYHSTQNTDVLRTKIQDSAYIYTYIIADISVQRTETIANPTILLYTTPVTANIHSSSSILLIPQLLVPAPSPAYTAQTANKAKRPTKCQPKVPPKISAPPPTPSP
jgi:hypothetical protein